MLFPVCLSVLLLVPTKPCMVVVDFLRGKAEMAGWMLTTVCKHAYKFQPIGACSVTTVWTEGGFIPGLLVLY